jgi:hypothetical protein
VKEEVKSKKEEIRRKKEGLSPWDWLKLKRYIVVEAVVSAAKL